MQANRVDRGSNDAAGLIAVGVGAAAAIGAIGYGLYSLFNANSEQTERPHSYERPTPQRPRYGSMMSCSICLEDLKENTRQLKCGHVYHKECINEWFAKGSEDRSCPYCRSRVNSF